VTAEPTACPVCELPGGFHDKDKHAAVEVPRKSIKPTGWLKCPLCIGWDEKGFPEKYILCTDHGAFMTRLDTILAENAEIIGRVDDRTRLEFGESLLQMREGRGRTVRPGERKGGQEWIEYGWSSAKGCSRCPKDLDELVAGEGDEHGQGDPR
jgi:hypothetical protein